MRILNDYVVVYQPQRNGWVYEHIFVLEQANIDIPDGFEVHHLDGDRSNNNLGNLIVLSSSDHTKLHNWMRLCGLNLKELRENRLNSKEPKQELLCKHCSKTLKDSQVKFCSTSCMNKNRAKMPAKEIVLNSSVSDLAETYEVTPKAVRAWKRKFLQGNIEPSP